ncbi:MAG: hypothetical protein JXQ71_08925 [Verrucomicrobia bacterium]|nr:hypothetical protein [Verrucomicrobiota bacterium]
MMVPKATGARAGLALAACLIFGLPAAGAPLQSAGPLYEHYRLTLEPGERTELLGPLFYHEEKELMTTWAFPGLMSDMADRSVDSEEFHLAYPVLTYHRFGGEYRFQILQFLSFAGGRTAAETNVSRFTLFPLFFRQRADDPALNYTAVFPFYGTLKNRLFRRETRWILWPLYAKTVRGGSTAPVNANEFVAPQNRVLQTRPGEITTHNFLVPLFHWRRGDGLRGWQCWPLTGHEHKTVTYRTNLADEVEAVGGHDHFFALWPLFFHHRTDLGTTNAGFQQVLLPFYSVARSPARDATTCLWPFGLTLVQDRARRYREWELFWPLVLFARGEGKSGNRVLPFFSVIRRPGETRSIYAWPFYHGVHLQTPALDRQRHRFLYFLYSDLTERSLETGHTRRRTQAWPLFTARRDFDGRRRLQVLSLLEPFLPNNESVERNLSPLWALLRSEHNPRTGAASQSLLWNTCRLETSPTSKKISLFFGLFRYQSGPEGTQWRVFHVPVASSRKGRRPGA